MADSKASAERELTGLKATIDQATASVRQAQILDKVLHDLQTQLADKEAFMPDGDNYDWMLRNIRSFEQDRRSPFKLEIEQPKFESMGIFPKFPYKAAVFHVSGRGFYHDLGKYLSDFENKFRYYQVANLEIKPGSGGGPVPLMVVGEFEGEMLQFSFDIITPVKAAATATK
jgi:hypothetical protein